MVTCENRNGCDCDLSSSQPGDLGAHHPSSDDHVLPSIKGCRFWGTMKEAMTTLSLAGTTLYDYMSIEATTYLPEGILLRALLQQAER